MRLERALAVVATPDVLVCGAGCAGVAAAIAAARRGASVMVVERWGFAGGFITAVVGPSLDGFIDLRSGRPMVGGIAFEFARLAAGATGDIAQQRYQPSTELRFESPDVISIRFDPEAFKLHADRLLRRAGVDVLYHSPVVDVLGDDGRVEGVVIANKAGLGVIRPKLVIDATGDADVAAWAGAPFDIEDELQPMSLHFRVARVTITPELRIRCTEVLAEAHRAGRLGVYGGPWINRLGPDELYINATRYPGSGIDPRDVTEAEIRGREDANLMFELFRDGVPEFEHAYLAATGPAIGVRESRRIRGDATLTRDDIIACTPREDAVLKGTWWLDRHVRHEVGDHVESMSRPYDVRPYDIGYGTLLPRTLSNVLVAGRCHSADAGALSSSRVTVTAMGMGQAAGTAAALATRTGTDARGVDVGALQQALLDDGAIILDRAEAAMAIGDGIAAGTTHAT
jgi:hypothetical protein